MSIVKAPVSESDANRIVQVTPSCVPVHEFRGSPGIPMPSSRQLLIRVHAVGAGACRDVVRRESMLDVEFGSLAVAGQVIAVGEAVTQFAIGDMVGALVAPAGDVRHVLADADDTLTIPSDRSAVEVVWLLGAFKDASFTLFKAARFVRGERLLILGAETGIGAVTTTLARSCGAGRITAVVNSRSACQASIEGGADLAILASDDVADLVWNCGDDIDIVLNAQWTMVPEWIHDTLTKNGRVVGLDSLEGKGTFQKQDGPRNRQRDVSDSTSEISNARTALVHMLRQHVWPSFWSGVLQAGACETLGLDDVDSGNESLVWSRRGVGIVLTTGAEPIG